MIATQRFQWVEVTTSNESGLALLVVNGPTRERVLNGLDTLSDIVEQWEFDGVKCEVEDCPHQAVSYWELGPEGDWGRNVCGYHFGTFERFRPLTPSGSRYGLTSWLCRSVVMRVAWSDGTRMLLTPLTGD